MNVIKCHHFFTYPEASHHNQRAIKHENYYMPFSYSGNLQGTKTCGSGRENESCLFHRFHLILCVSKRCWMIRWQATSHTAATCAALSSTGRPTWRLTPAFTPGRSHTAATPVALALFRWDFLISSNLVALEDFVILDQQFSSDLNELH